MTTTKKFYYYAFVLLGTTLMLFSSCKKDGEDDIDDTKIVKDIDGNVYKTVKIGTQDWFAENLKTTKYNNGTPIPTGHTDEQWEELSSGAYAIYPHADIDGLNSDAEVFEAYGALYNWYAVETGNLCPTGWHVPTDAEWTVLTDFIGGPSIAGGKLKETGTTHWYSPNDGATNETGFTALPGGGRNSDGPFGDIGSYGNWWSATEKNATNVWYRDVNYTNSNVYIDSGSKESGYSVRCVRD